MSGFTDRKGHRKAGHRAHGATSGRLPRLTPKEKTLARLILSGCSNREIAEKSGVSIKTVKNQLTTLFEKVGVASRLQLALFIVKNDELARTD